MFDDCWFCLIYDIMDWVIFMKDLVKSGKKILKKLNEHAYEAFFVGGYVRDQILGIESDDIDITTNALPEQIEALFEKTIPTGKKFGTITVLLDGFSFEVTTYRVDQEYKNHRQPSQVFFSKDLREDLIRRDFTINAMAMDIDGVLIDLFGGQEDIKEKRIKAIQDPYQRFKEDALRILRAIRFAGKLNFNIEEDTMKAMKDDVYLLKKLARERISKEFKLILSQEYVGKSYLLMNDIQLFKVFDDLGQAIVKLNNKTENYSLEEFFALAIYPTGVLNDRQWRLSKKEKSNIESIVYLMELLYKHRINPMVAYHYQENHILSADKLLSHFYDYQSQKDKIINLYKHLKISNYQDLNITGKDISNLVNDKSNTGQIIDKLIEEVLLAKLENKKEILLNRAKELAEEINEL